MTAVSTFAELRSLARASLHAAGIDESAIEADLLLAHAAGVSRSRVLASLGEQASEDFGVRFESLLGRRRRREPLAYILGYREFFGRRFVVNPDVLIPRPESELLVELALGAARSFGDQLELIDIGSGSGALGLSILAEAPAQAMLIATDTSRRALAVTNVNARALKLRARCNTLRCDLVSALAPSRLPRVLVANLPYIAESDAPTLQPEVRDHEPPGALYAGEDGLAANKRLLRDLPRIMRPGDRAYLECGYAQGHALLDLSGRLAPAARLDLHLDGRGIARALELMF